MGSPAHGTIDPRWILGTDLSSLHRVLVKGLLLGGLAYGAIDPGWMLSTDLSSLQVDQIFPPNSFAKIGFRISSTYKSTRGAQFEDNQP